MMVDAFMWSVSSAGDGGCESPQGTRLISRRTIG